MSESKIETGAPEHGKDSRAVLCAKCERLNQRGANSCERCGAHLYISCSDCGQRNERVRTRCVHCGRRMHRSALDRFFSKFSVKRAGITPLTIILYLAAMAFAWSAIKYFAGLETSPSE